MTLTQAEFTLRRIHDLINRELDSACQKHPQFPMDIIHQVAVVGEEAGEAMRAALQLTYEDGDVDELKKELIQTAASCIRVLFKIAEGEYRAINTHPRITNNIVTNSTVTKSKPNEHLFRNQSGGRMATSDAEASQHC